MVIIVYKHSHIGVTQQCENHVNVINRRLYWVKISTIVINNLGMIVGECGVFNDKVLRKCEKFVIINCIGCNGIQEWLVFSYIVILINVLSSVGWVGLTFTKKMLTQFQFNHLKNRPSKCNLSSIPSKIYSFMSKRPSINS